jgi:hypothetical protein
MTTARSHFSDLDPIQMSQVAIRIKLQVRMLSKMLELPAEMGYFVVS